jgi:hypothetical protein
LDFLKAAALGFGYHELHPKQLEYHHQTEEQEDVSWSKGRDHLWEERGQERGKDPMREAAQ